MAATVEPERLVFVDECGTHTSLCPDLRLRAQGRAIAAFGAAEAGQEHHAALEHDHRGDGTVSGRGRGDHRQGLRDLRREGARAELYARDR